MLYLHVQMHYTSKVEAGGTRLRKAFAYRKCMRGEPLREAASNGNYSFWEVSFFGRNSLEADACLREISAYKRLIELKGRFREVYAEGRSRLMESVFSQGSAYL